MQQTRLPRRRKAEGSRAGRRTRDGSPGIAPIAAAGQLGGQTERGVLAKKI